MLSPQIDSVIGDRKPSFEEVRQLRYCTRVVNEGMRMYPQPPVLIRRALGEDELGGYRVPAGSDIFISVWNLHRWAVRSWSVVCVWVRAWCVVCGWGVGRVWAWWFSGRQVVGGWGVGAVAQQAGAGCVLAGVGGARRRPGRGCQAGGRPQWQGPRRSPPAAAPRRTRDIPSPPTLPRTRLCCR